MTDEALEPGARQNLTDGWSLLGTSPAAVPDPNGLPEGGWVPAVVPGTVAAAVGPDDPWAHSDYDDRDWWYRCQLAGPADRSERHYLCFEGLATLASVWLNGERILESDNMFRRHRVEVTDLLRDENMLILAFWSLGARLGERHARPRWKTALVSEQDLRWYRTTLMGRMPGWTPPIKPVGPWRGIVLEREPAVSAHDLRVRAEVDADLRRSVRLDGTVTSVEAIQGVRLRIGDVSIEVEYAPTDGGARIETTVAAGEVPLWWPHTHGDPSLVPLVLDVETDGGGVAVDLGRAGFRRVEVDRDDGRIRYRVNGLQVFCRGACWTPTDVATLDGSPEALRAVLQRLASAHGNMVRVGGTMTYEADSFYDICDELGIMVWQDFMFANMDYPIEDDDFEKNVTAEARQEVARLARHASVVTWCGGSEVEQQAAMFGAPREIWSSDLFAELLPTVVEELHTGTPYWPSTPTGGALPFHVGEGLTHYYGVGAYLRPLDDVRLAGVRFTPETLGFSNVPEPEVVHAMTPDGPVAPHHPVWKRGVPRDSGAGWDFEDVRDHYLELVHGVDAMRLRYEDLQRYWALSRTVPGHLMERVFREWRADSSGCGGGLVWFLRDLVQGAGWGVLDHHGDPKASYYYLRRSWAPRIASLLDRGLDGLRVDLVNDSGAPAKGSVHVRVVDKGSRVTASGERSIEVSPWSRTKLSVDEMIGHFMDLTYAYRFGPSKHEAVLLEWLDTEGRLIAGDCLVVDRARSASDVAVLAAVEAIPGEGNDLRLRLESDALVHDVRIEMRHHVAEDNYLTLHPGSPREVRLRWRGTEGPFRGRIDALNLATPMRLTGPS